MNKRIFQFIALYTLVLLLVNTILNISGAINEVYTNTFQIFVPLLLILINVLFLIITFNLIIENYNKLTISFVFYYWFAQILFFGFYGYKYSFSSGPQIALYFKYIGKFNFGFFINYWSKEFTLAFNLASDRLYVGINILPIIIIVFIAYYYNKNKYWEYLKCPVKRRLPD